jgi:hypothetical protein
MGFHLLKGKVITKSSAELKLVSEEPRLSQSFDKFDKVDAELIPSDPKLVEAAQAAFASFSPLPGNKELLKHRNSVTESRKGANFGSASIRDD